MSFLSRRAYLLAPIGLLLVVVTYGACTPGSEITAAESDVVVTTYDDDFNFGSVKTFAMPDSILLLTSGGSGSKGDWFSREEEVRILGQIESNFVARGYSKEDTNATPLPDFAVVVAAQATDYVNLYSYYPGYGWWGYYWWYYPPSVGASYAYTLGTLYVHMGDFAKPAPDDKSPEEAYWIGAMNGILNDNSSNRNNRLTSGINQIFEQSPYLKTDL